MAALCCLALAAASALTPAHGRPSAAAVTIADQLRAGEVAVSVQVTSVPAELRRGDRIGLLTGPSDAGGEEGTATVGAHFVGDRLRVLAVVDPQADGSDPPSVLVAARREAALRIAAGAGRSVLVVVDEAP
jgi:hypothetical protein